MKRIRTGLNPTLLSKHFQWRTTLLSALLDFQLAKAGQTAEALSHVIAELEEAATHVAEDEARAIGMLRELTAGFQRLCQWASARRAGEADANRHLDAAKEQAAITTECLGGITFPSLREAATSVVASISAANDTSALSNIAALLARVPIPPFLIASKDPLARYRTSEQSPESSIAEGPFVVRVMLTLDGRPWSNPQVLGAGVIYDLKAKVTAPAWPSQADRMVLDVVTTLQPEHCRMSALELHRMPGGDSMESTLTCHIEFPVGQSFLAEPALLQMRATFLSTAEAGFARTATIVGYHKLRVRVSDPKTTPLLSKYRVLDQRVVTLVDDVRDLSGLGESHLADFIEVLSAVVNYMGICAQQAIYRSGREILEKDFQRDLLLHLRGQLGEDVQEAPKLGGGITDVRYRSVTVELKVEKDIGDRDAMLQSYQCQPTQYSSAAGAQLGILCVLDLTEKTLPPAPPQNNVRMLTPALHGFGTNEAPYPVRIAAVIIDGNIRRPSDYSR